VLRHDPEVIGELHVQVLRAVARANDATEVPDLRLDGGTALAAFYLSHRQSEDLDVFGGLTLNARALGERVRDELAREGVDFEVAGPQTAGFARFIARERDGGEATGVRVDFAATSPFLLESIEPTEEGIGIASFRDVCAGKLHALCDRFEARDYVDLHAILHRPAGNEPVDETLLRTRFRTLLDDLILIDPGIDARYVGQGFARAMDKPLLSLFPLRLLKPLTDAEIQATLRLCFDECARIVSKLSPE
jgi:hypothetical protein